jgi:hypothetical protein
MRARVISPSPAQRSTPPDDHALQPQKTETKPLCSTLPEDAPTTLEATTPAQPLLLPAPAAPEAPSTALLALEAADTPPSDRSDANPQPTQVDPQRRLAFARYLFRRGIFNEGFPREALPAQYRQRAPEA